MTMHLQDDGMCFEVIRAHRWPEEMRRPHCHANQITKRSREEKASTSYTAMPLLGV